MTSKAETLRAASDREVDNWEGRIPEFESVVDKFIRTIVEELRITLWSDLQERNMACSILLELADHGK